MNCDHDAMDSEELIGHMFSAHRGHVIGGALTGIALALAWFIALAAAGR